MGLGCTFYNFCFLVYTWLVPVFLQYLIRAPSTFDSAPFYPVPMSTLGGDVPELYMSSFPQTTAEGVNHCRPCKQYNHYKTGMYQWDIMLSMSYKDLITDSSDKTVSTMYPVIFASNDAVTWNVVADADDVAQNTWANPSGAQSEEPTHISAPLLIANLKNFGCVDDELSDTDPFMRHFSSKEKARQFKWKLVDHVAVHGSVNLVACVMQGMDDINQLIHTYARHCIVGDMEMKCHLSPTQALQKCFAIGSACGQACGFFSPDSPHCIGGTLDPALFAGLTNRRVKLKTRGGGGAAEALVYCSQKPCGSGLHFENMYVEAENPLEFLEAQRDVRNQEKGSFNVLMFAVSDFHAPIHTFSVTVDTDEDEKEKGTKDTEKDDKEKDSKKDTSKKGEEDKKEESTEKPKKKKQHERTCVDLPGVRLEDIEHSGLDSFVDDDKVSSPLDCTTQCGKMIKCKQSVWSSKNNGCYLFKISTVQVNQFDASYNSSYCGDKHDENIMMTMLHQAYKGYVPEKKPMAAPAGPPASAPAPLRRLKQDQRFYWQIAHTPNLTLGVMKDQGASAMRVIPRNGSCFTTPGFIYMVACMTAKPVYMSGRSLHLDPPPFNDRCLAVGGLCGATCGSGQGADQKQARYCPMGDDARRLQSQSVRSPYASARIPREMLVRPIEPRRSATTTSIAARLFFHLFIFFIAVSYVSTILGKFPGNFTDFYPVHTWEEVRTHGYVVEKFGSAVSTGVSAAESKMIVFRNWLGKIAARPCFDDPAFPTFSKWVDVFCDEGHREGARILWYAWAAFLDTNPPIEFLQQWSENVRSLTFEQAQYYTPFDLEWKNGDHSQKVLPITAEQGFAFLPAPGSKVPEGGVVLQQDSLAKLKELYEVYRYLPDSLKIEPSLPKNEDVTLTRTVSLGFQSRGKKAKGCFTVTYSSSWRKELDQKIEQRMNQIGISSKPDYQTSLIVTDNHGKRVDAFGGKAASLTEAVFPLHFREPNDRADRQVIMVYCARAKPESDRKGIPKTRGLDKYLWACLRPKAVRQASGEQPRRSFKKKEEERQPLLTENDRPWSSVSGDGPEGLVLEEVRRSVEAVVTRQHDKFLAKKDPVSAHKSPLSTLQKEYAKAYLKFRTVDSDWEMARFCYGEIVGEELDKDGNEVLILDNPSPALLELVSDLHTGMGLVALETEEETSCCGLRRTPKKTARATKPSLEFLFANTNAKAATSPPAEFQQELRKKLQAAMGASAEDAKGLVIEAKCKGTDLVAEVTGPGKIIEPIRDRNLANIQVLNYLGRMIDSHPTVIVRKDMMMPYAGVRGKSGGLNYVVDLLQFRQGFIGTAAEGDTVPERMLYGIFDARHQPHPDYWQKVLPKFMYNCDSGYTYEVNDAISMVQAPQSFPAVDVEEDVLDVHNGLCFNLMNIIRNRCGGVTSCGTNAVWMINAKDFSRQGENAESLEYFDSRTKIEDTASTHIQFCSGKRSVYVQEKVSTGIAKLNADYLCALQRWAEGAVQLFWMQLFVDKTRQLVAFAFCMIGFWWTMYFFLYGGWTKDFEMIGYNIFCDIEGTPTLLLGMDHSFCDSLYGLFSQFLEHTIDRVIYQMAAEDYMRLIDFSITWLFVVIGLAITTAILSAKGIMPKIVRIFIMMENISYWLASCSIFFWLALTLFMIIGMNPPLMFNVTHFMMFILGINICNHCMINEYKNMGGCSELSIWRSQQAYTLAAPLYVMAIARGTAASWSIIWQGHDKSFWTSNEYGSETIRGVTVWVTFIWSSFVFCMVYLMIHQAKGWLFNEIGDKIQKQCQVVAVMMLGLVAITVWEPFLALWGVDKSIKAMSKVEHKEDEEGEKEGSEQRTWLHVFASILVWWRSKAWIMRYVIDFGMPFLVLSGMLGGGVSILMLAAHSAIIHGFRA